MLMHSNYQCKFNFKNCENFYSLFAMLTHVQISFLNLVISKNMFMKGKINRNTLFITEQVQYLVDSRVHMYESKAEQKLAVNEQEMWCAGFAWINCGVPSGRESF